MYYIALIINLIILIYFSTNLIWNKGYFKLILLFILGFFPIINIITIFVDIFYVKNLIVIKEITMKDTKLNKFLFGKCEK